MAPNMTPEAVTERTLLLSALAQQAGLEVCGKDLLSVSMGAAFCPRHGVDAEQLLAEADRKMYSAKRLHYKNRELLQLGLGHSRFTTVN